MDTAAFLEAVASTSDAKARLALLEDHPALHTRESASRLCAEALRLTMVDPRRADRLAQAARWMAERLQDSPARAEALRISGHVLYARGKYLPALERYQSALRIFEELGLQAGVGRTLSGALQSLIYLGRYQQALDWAAKARAIFEQSGDRLRLARLDSNAGNILYRQDRFEEAQALYLKAYREFQESGTPQDIAAVLSNMAVCAISLNDFEQALDYYGEARDWCQCHDMPLLVAEADYNIAYLFYLRGEYARAIDLYELARAHCRQLDDRYHQALCDLDQAEMYLELNLGDDGEQLAARALDGFRRLGMGYETAKSIAFLAIAASQQGRAAGAVTLFDQARELFVKENNRIWPALIDLYKALVLYQNGNVKRSRRLCRAALSFFAGTPLHGKTAVCQLLLARLQLDAGRADQARELSLAALERARRADSPALRCQAWFVLGSVQEALGRAGEALEAFRQAHQALEDLRSNLRGEELKIAFLKDKLAIFEGLVTHSLRDPRAAFGFIEQAKSRSLADLIAFRAQELPATVSTPLAGRIQELREELNWSHRQIERRELRQGNPAEIENLRRRARQHEEQLRRVLAELQEADREFLSLQNARTVDLDSICAALPPDTVLLEYYQARGTIYAGLMSRNRLSIRALSAAAPVQDAFRLLRFQLSKFQLGGPYLDTFGSTLETATSAHLRDLYAGLIAPVRRYLRGRRLVIVPHGFLHHLPFHALLQGKRYLCDDFDISYAPSASVYHLCGSKTLPPSSESLVLGVPDPRAPLMGKEAEKVAAVLPNPRLFLGEEATEDCLRQYGPVSRYIHIATHGLFRQDNPMFSSIRMGRGQLTLFDLYQLRLGAELVTLSGCGTGLNVVVGGDELLGLVRGLLYAGAASVLVTLWDVNDASTADFMLRFYDHLRSSPDKAMALRAAMAEIRRIYSHPYYWAPFVLVGSGPGGAGQ